jgi:hypothetical protein
MSSRRLFWVLPLSAIVLAGLTVWEQSNIPRRRISARPVEGIKKRLVARPFQFELYDSENRTVRLARYLGRHRIELVFVKHGGVAATDPVVVSIKKIMATRSDSGILLVVSPELPQSLRVGTADVKQPEVVLLSDAGGRRGQLPGGAADAWGVSSPDGLVKQTRWFAIDRAGQVAWNSTGPLAGDTEKLLGGDDGRKRTGN